METIDIKEKPLKQCRNNMAIQKNNTLVLPSELTGISNLETIDIKEEPLEQSSNNMPIDESKKSENFPMVHERINSSRFATVPVKNEVFQPEIVPTHMPHLGVLPSNPIDIYKMEGTKMENEIVKLFEEFDKMTLHNYDQTRVRKVRQLVEKYQIISQKLIFELHENTLEVKTNELERIKVELQMTKSTNLTLSNRIHELEMARNQVSDQKKSVNKAKSKEKKRSFKSSDIVFAPGDHRRGDVKIVHEGTKPFKCNICPSAFPQKGDLTRHIIAVHEKKKTSKSSNETIAGKKYICEICERVFNDNRNRKTHIRSVHEGKKPYSCSICKKAYKQNAHLKRHISSFHDKEKAFNCKLCSASYSRKYDLTHHEKKCAEINHDLLMEENS